MLSELLMGVARLAAWVTGGVRLARRCARLSSNGTQCRSWWEMVREGLPAKC